MKHASRVAVMAVAIVSGLAACATGSSLSDTQKLALYQRNAGEPVAKIRYFGTPRSWEPVGDQALVVWVRGNEGYLFTLDAQCPDLSFGRAISIGDQTGDVFAGFDSVRVLGATATAPGLACRIRTIQPLDRAGLKEDEKAIRQSAGGT
ncbi:DUF6491 family protein [Lysobacter sp. GX 14042]|uniref:DUF6491 family protein n=1 Tax=Lysobacter sp. GX 14042 TaxID=2907155 RepID=UPI001F36A84C|nr:DUF6491 family protein [Lysobacter sp. GX 14042]MCE7031671.1 DUF6491 family protein [Lysobacter sp. GX 14042]